MPSELQPFEVMYFDGKTGKLPNPREFLATCPVPVRAKFFAVLKAVSEAPPPRFSGGGYWEAMHGAMAGWYEIRLTGPGREQFRVFCVLRSSRLIVVTGMRKRNGEVFDRRDYERIRALEIF